MSTEDPASPDKQPDKERQAIPADEPFDVWWPKYLAKVQESVAAAENYLAVPPGTISSIESDQDYIATVKTYAVIDPILNDLILAHPPRPRLPIPFVDPEPSAEYREFVLCPFQDELAN
jgi:hypothetical protein